MEVFVCSNSQCGAAFDYDPKGHCPICIRSDGIGFSCRAVSVRTAEDTVREIRTRAERS